MQTPMPNPTTFNQLQQNLSEVIQQGIVGVLILVGIMGVIIAASVFIYLWNKRNQPPPPPPVDTTAGTNAAINAFAEMIQAQNDQIAEDRKLRREEATANREQIQKLNERYIESISANADATNRIADNHDKLVALWQSEIGSKPYQGLIETTNRIEISVENIVKNLQPANKETQKKQVADIQRSLDDLKQFVVTIVTNLQTDKRATGSLRPVTLPSQDSIEGTP